MNFVARLLTMIFGIVFVALGLTFTIVGLAAADQEAFLYIGPPLLVAGLASAGVCLWLTSKERAARARRRNGTRAKAPIVAMKLYPYTRVGVMITYDMTVRVPAPRGVTEATRRVLVPPNFTAKPGDEIEIYFDPEEPTNFEPALDLNRT